jgi:hypothetical protein
MMTKAILEYPTVLRKGKALSSALLEGGALPGDEIRRIFAEAEVPPEVVRTTWIP